MGSVSKEKSAQFVTCGRQTDGVGHAEAGAVKDVSLDRRPSPCETNLSSHDLTSGQCGWQGGSWRRGRYGTLRRRGRGWPLGCVCTVGIFNDGFEPLKEAFCRLRIYRRPPAIMVYYSSSSSSSRWLGSRVVSVLDSGAVGPGFKSQPRRCRVTVLGKLFTPIVPLFTNQRNW